MARLWTSSMRPRADLTDMSASVGGRAGPCRAVDRTSTGAGAGLVPRPGRSLSSGCAICTFRAMKLYRVILPVSDIEAAATFYQTLLDLAGERVSAGRHYLSAGAVILALVDLRADGQNRDPRPNQEHLYFSTEDLAEARARAVTAKPSTGPTEIRDMPWGERSFYLSDPWENPLCIVEEGSEFTSGGVS